MVKMGHTMAVGARPERAGLLSLGAFGLSVAGVAAATGLIFAIDSEPERVRWWLVVTPVAISAFPLLIPKNAARLFAALLLTAWCFVAMFSIGMFLLPALVAQFGAWIKERS
jgi:hypothetical protein